MKSDSLKFVLFFAMNAISSQYFTTDRPKQDVIHGVKIPEEVAVKYREKLEKFKKIKELDEEYRVRKCNSLLKVFPELLALINILEGSSDISEGWSECFVHCVYDEKYNVTYCDVGGPGTHEFPVYFHRIKEINSIEIDGVIYNISPELGDYFRRNLRIPCDVNYDGPRKNFKEKHVIKYVDVLSLIEKSEVYKCFEKQ